MIGYHDSVTKLLDFTSKQRRDRENLHRPETRHIGRAPVRWAVAGRPPAAGPPAGAPARHRRIGGSHRYRKRSKTRRRFARSAARQHHHLFGRSLEHCRADTRTAAGGPGAIGSRLPEPLVKRRGREPCRRPRQKRNAMEPRICWGPLSGRSSMPPNPLRENALELAAAGTGGLHQSPVRDRSIEDRDRPDFRPSFTRSTRSLIARRRPRPVITKLR